MGLSIFCSCRGARFGFQSPYGALQPHGTLGSGDLMPSQKCTHGAHKNM